LTSSGILDKIARDDQKGKNPDEKDMFKVHQMKLINSMQTKSGSLKAYVLTVKVKTYIKGGKPNEETLVPGSGAMPDVEHGRGRRR
jgi:hypothetical protein